MKSIVLTSNAHVNVRVGFYFYFLMEKGCGQGRNYDELRFADNDR
jgi:hypothetical protein